MASLHAEQTQFVETHHRETTNLITLHQREKMRLINNLETQLIRLVNLREELDGAHEIRVIAGQESYVSREVSGANNLLFEFTETGNPI
ncbi:hypothetical protein L915_06096 [Phytophthora nicotianae]|uniref:Uncharacterized protein n=1 Tax=Phytophthora nicotianae TaxID=4792 RepID=W2H479_PHYNI|nr:hypothetical protein L915_06096 [Phytophthora nicotianae]